MRAAPKQRVISLLCVLLIGLTAACNEDPSAGPERGVTIDDVEESDALFGGDLDGEIVTVSGEVRAMHTERLFRVASELIGGEGVLIVVPRGETRSNVTVYDIVRVTGEVQHVTPSDLRGRFDIDTSVDLEAVDEDDPMIVADEVHTIDGE